jgi:hypothetical protein
MGNACGVQRDAATAASLVQGVATGAPIIGASAPSLPAKQESSKSVVSHDAAVTTSSPHTVALKPPSRKPPQATTAVGTQALVTLLSQRATLPMQLALPEVDPHTLSLLPTALEQQHAAIADTSQLVQPLLVASQRCAGDPQLAMRQVFLLVSVVV